MSLRARPSLDVRVQRRQRRAVVRQRLTGSVTRDPKTGKVRRGSIKVSATPLCRCPEEQCYLHLTLTTCSLRWRQSAPTVVLTLPKRLEPPNVWLWTNWRTKSAAKNAWKTLIVRTAVEQLGWMKFGNGPRTAGSRVVLFKGDTATHTLPAAALGWTPPRERVRVDIVRHVTRGRGITDADNLLFSAKGLGDCLVQTGFLADDSTDHIDLHVSQVPSVDGLDLTVVTIAPIPAAPGVPEC